MGNADRDSVESQIFDDEYEKAKELIRRKTIDLRFRQINMNLSETGEEDTVNTLLDSVLTRQNKQARSQTDIKEAALKSKEDIQN